MSESDGRRDVCDGTGLLLGVAALASFILARSSTRIEPVTALRVEG
jgi:hypothetical protein